MKVSHCFFSFLSFVDQQVVVAEQKVFTGKIFSLTWLKDEDIILVCGPDGTIKLLRHTQCLLTVISSYVLPYSRQRWVSSAALVPSNDYNDNNKMATRNDFFLVCGDRRGSLHLYSGDGSEVCFHYVLGLTRNLSSVRHKNVAFRNCRSNVLINIYCTFLMWLAIVTALKEVYLH